MVGTMCYTDTVSFVVMVTQTQCSVFPREVFTAAEHGDQRQVIPQLVVTQSPFIKLVSELIFSE